MPDLITRTDAEGREWIFDPEFRTWRAGIAGPLVICGSHRPGGRTERWQTFSGGIHLDVDDAMASAIADARSLRQALDTMQANHDEILALAGDVYDASVARWRRLALSSAVVAGVSLIAGLLAAML